MKSEKPQAGKARAPDDHIRRPGAAGDLGRAIRDAFLETLWPTRCAVCDRPGSLLCDRCRAGLPYIDRWRACTHCGAALGIIQCTECNPVILAHLERSELPFAACASVVLLDERTRRIVTLHKDAGERRLAETMARLMARIVDPAWLPHVEAVSWIPASAAALRRRGFDHAEAIARSLAAHCALPARALLERPSIRTRDQRALSRSERFENMRGRFCALGCSADPSRGSAALSGVILIDDVYTTGATLCAASDALRDAGVREVFCLTFARAL